jgi:O-antigen ligase
MSETLDTNSTAPQGKGMAVAGFILALVGLVFSGIIAGIAALSIATGGSGWLMYFWLVLCIASVVMCAMGMSKLGKTGGKKGLAIAGLVIGIVATVWAIVLTLGLGAADAAVDGDLGDEFRKQMQEELNK